MQFKSTITVLVTGSLIWHCSMFSSTKEEIIPVELHVQNDDSVYVGVPLKFWTHFVKPVTDYNSISWALGEGQLFGNRKTGDAEEITDDTVYIEWTRLPIPISSEQTEGMAGYVDTISVTVDGIRSVSIPIKITNVFPVIDSVVLDNGLTHKIIDDSVYIKVRQGAPVVLEVHTSDLLNELPVDIVWPDFMWKEGVNPRPNDVDGMYYFDNAPISLFDKSGLIRIQDGAGAERNYSLRYQTYKPDGSMWVGSGVELVNLAGEGFEIFRSNFDLGSGPMLEISKEFNSLYIVDEGKKRIERYNFLNFVKDLSFTHAANTKIQNFKLGANYFWVAYNDQVVNNASTLAKHSLDDGSYLNFQINSIPGTIVEMEIEQNSPGNLWYINSESDSIFYAENDSIIYSVYDGLENPGLISYDNETQVLWVANNHSLFTYTKEGFLRGQLKGFQNITSIASGLGRCWVADGFVEKIYLIDSDIAADRNLEELASTEFSKEVTDPVDVVMIRGEVPRAMLAEYSSGSVVKLDEKGDVVFRLSGINLPRKIVINQAY